MDNAFVNVGVDVAAKTFEVCFGAVGRRPMLRDSFKNTPEDRARFIKKLEGRMRKDDVARVCLESTGVYSLDLSWLLHQTESVEVMVVNPRVLSKFRGATATRNKTDREDAEIALQYVQRMEFQRWEAPSRSRMMLRQLVRRIEDLVDLSVQEQNRRHSAESTAETPAVVLESIKDQIVSIEKNIAALRQEARRLVSEEAKLERMFKLLITVKGIAEITAIKLLSELAVLPEGLTAKQWVAWAGLDPTRYESGTSVKYKSTISRRGSSHLRHALYMPALCAASHDKHVKEFYRCLRERGKPHGVALVAVMRKLLHAIYGMFRHDRPYDGAKFRAISSPS